MTIKHKYRWRIKIIVSLQRYSVNLIRGSSGLRVIEGEMRGADRFGGRLVIAGGKERGEDQLSRSGRPRPLSRRTAHTAHTALTDFSGRRKRAVETVGTAWISFPNWEGEHTDNIINTIDYKLIFVV